MSGLTSYATLKVKQLEVVDDPLNPRQVASKYYVDNIKKELLGDGEVLAHLDSIKELGDFLDKEGTAGGIVQQLSSLGLQITAVGSEASTNLSGAISGLTTTVTSQISGVQNNVSALQTAASSIRSDYDTSQSANVTRQSAIDQAFSAEEAARTAADAQLGGRVDVFKSAYDSFLVTNATRQTAIDGFLDTKFDKAGGAVSGNVAISGYLSIGPHWRIAAVGNKILEFQNSPAANGVWTCGIPFISL